MTDTPAVVAVGLEQRYGKRRVICGLNVELSRGGVVGLLGPNGSGKTTLVITLATLRRPAGGSLRVMGYDPAHRAGRRAIRRHLGYLPQTFGYHPRFTAQEFVEYLGWLKKVPSRRLREEANAALDAVGLADRTSDRLGTLSGGMLRRAGIAAAMVNRPRLLLLDEPTAGLDPVQRVELRRLVERLGNECTVLLSTHLVEDVASMCSRTLVMRSGTIAYSGSPQELAALGGKDQPGDSPIERGYSAALLGSPC
jgi:ABC-2 type transport system ATP-binding protein